MSIRAAFTFTLGARSAICRHSTARSLHSMEVIIAHPSTETPHSRALHCLMISLPRGDDAVLGETESRLSDRKLKSPFKPALAWSAVRSSTSNDGWESELVGTDIGAGREGSRVVPRELRFTSRVRSRPICQCKGRPNT